MHSRILFALCFISMMMGQPSFTANTISTSADNARSVFAADMDNDGDMDIVSASSSDDKIAWYENNGSSNPSWTASDIATSADGANCVFVADMDNDGDMDIVSASYSDNTIAWYENDGAANPSWTAADIATSANGANWVFVADMDNDGDMDIISSSQNDDAIAWYENNGSSNPSWTSSDIATSADGANCVFAADMDNDGDMDILSSSYLDDAIAWYENDGNADPSFTAADIATSADGATSVFAADMDGDGDMDIISSSQYDDAIAWYRNDGAADPSWTAADIATSAEYANSVFVADMDNDGNMDIVSASKADDKIAWYENNSTVGGIVAWTAAEILTSTDISYPSSNGARSVYAEDMDNDGDMDVLSASIDDDKINWYENNGSESFTAHTITFSAEDATSVYAIDIDGDGDMDVVSASSGDNTIAWYKNNGSQSFSDHHITNSADGAESVYAIDVDGDGDMDVLSASRLDDKIAW